VVAAGEPGYVGEDTGGDRRADAEQVHQVRLACGHRGLEFLLERFEFGVHGDASTSLVTGVAHLASVHFDRHP
jgi:hypothetical protein